MRIRCEACHTEFDAEPKPWPSGRHPEKKCIDCPRCNRRYFLVEESTDYAEAGTYWADRALTILQQDNAEIRYHENRARVFRLFQDAHTLKLSICISWGSSFEEAGEIIRKYGPREASAFLPTREKWFYDIDNDKAKEILSRWKKSCDRAGLSGSVKFIHERRRN